MSRAHIPVFRTVTEWDAKRTTPCWAECPCGWSSEVVRDQTTAEWIHGQHMQQVGAIPSDDPFLVRRGDADCPTCGTSVADCRTPGCCDHCVTLAPLVGPWREHDPLWRTA